MAAIYAMLGYRRDTREPCACTGVTVENPKQLAECVGLEDFLLAPFAPVGRDGGNHIAYVWRDGEYKQYNDVAEWAAHSLTRKERA